MDTTVRPTKRALNDMGVTFPPLNERLHGLKHPLIEKAQSVPEMLDGGSAERVLFVTDRVLYKVKVREYRGVAGRYRDIKENPWWLVACGERRRDSRRQDFYESLKIECQRAAKGKKQAVDSSHLSPTDIDLKRLKAEITTLAIENIKAIVREAICRSAQTSVVWKRTIGEHGIAAFVKSRDGETYLSIISDGFVAPDVIAVILSSVPGIPPEDWMPDALELPDFTPRRDQVVFSAIIPAEVLAQLLEEHDRTHL